MHQRRLTLPPCRHYVAILALSLGLSVAADGRAAQIRPNGGAEQASIAFANLGGIRDWRASDDDTLYVQGRNRQWYRAELLAPCTGLDFTTTIGFNFTPSGTFDRFSSVIVDGRECHLKSLIESAPPNDGQRGKSGESAGAAQANAASRETAADGQAGQSAGEPARIAFADLGGIQSWRVVDDTTLFIEGRNRRWYRAELLGSCPGLNFESELGFVLQPGRSFDRFSSIMVDGRECPLKSLTASDPPTGR